MNMEPKANEPGGCWAYHWCLSCPFPTCYYDAGKTRRNKWRAMALARKEPQLSEAQIAMKANVSLRTATEAKAVMGLGAVV